MTIRLRPGARPPATPEPQNPPEAPGEWRDTADASLAASAPPVTPTDASAGQGAPAPAGRSDTKQSGRADAEAANSDGQPALAWAPPAV